MMMKRRFREFALPVPMLLLAALQCAAAENLVANGDFTSAAQNLSPLCRAEAGRVSLHVEDLTWNSCGKCEVSQGLPDVKHPGCEVFAANALIGFSAPNCGFAVTPGTRYDVAFDVRSLVGDMKISADIVVWTGDGYWRDRTTVKSVVPGGVKAGKDWRTFKGSFRAPEGAVRAALRLAIHSSTKWKDVEGYRLYAVGDAFLFDNVRVAESRRNLGGADAAPKAAVRKAVAAGETFCDLVSSRDGRSPAQERTEFRIWRERDALCVDAAAYASGGIDLGTTNAVWSGDTIEVQIEARDGSRPRTHVAFNNAGAKYTDAGEGLSNDDWELNVEVGATNWTSHARLPLTFLGLKDPLPDLGVNVGRARAKARTFDCWSPGPSFHDPESFGRVLFEGYSAALAREFGGSFEVSGREAFAAAWAACEAKRLEEKLARFKEAKLSVAPVSTLSDWSIPFLPEEIFDPPSNIVLKAAVNEMRALPLAIANLTDRVEDYRIALETDGGMFAGGVGLSGFPAAQIAVRKGVRMRDVEGVSPSLRFDPLVRLDEAGIVTIPPREAGLVWYDFDCTGVKPGVYRGWLRAIPLCEEGKIAGSGAGMRYSGKMQTIPVSLEVVDAELPLRAPTPALYFAAAPTKAVFDAAFWIGAETFQAHSWAFSFERDGAGNLDLDHPKPPAVALADMVSNHVAWAAQYGFRPRFAVVYSAMDACAGLYGCTKDAERFRRLWPQYVRGVKKIMNGAGVPDADFAIEVRDEPRIEMLPKVLEAHKLAKEACPTVRLMMLLASWKPSVEQMREFVPYADEWVLWRGAYFGNGAYRSFVEELKAAGKRVSAYSCDTSIRVPLLQYYRHHAWHGRRHGLHGMDMYQLFDHVNGGGFGRKDFIAPPRGGLIYGISGMPVPSLRYMALREGFTDCKVLAALEARNAKDNDPEVAAFLGSAALEVLDRRPNDAALPDRMRERARELLIRRPR